jgi:hypothetical protein
MTVVDIDGTAVEFPADLTGDALNRAVARAARQMMPPSTSEAVQRGVGLAGKGFNEAVGATVGAPFDIANWALKQPARLLPDSVRDKLPDLPPGGFYGQQAGAALNALGRNDTPETTAEDAIYGAGKGVGNVASMLAPAGIVANMARPGSLAAGVAKTMTTQPAMQVASGVAGGAVGEATDSPALGMAAALAVPVGASVSRGVISPGSMRSSAETQRLAAVAKREGIPLTPGQATGKAPMRTLESVFGQLPSTAGKQAALTQAQREAFTRAALERAGVRGETLATPEVLRAARERIGNTISDMAGRNNLKVDPNVTKPVWDLAVEAKRYLPADKAKPVLARISDFIEKIDTKTMQVDGKAYAKLDSALSAQIRGEMDGNVRNVLQQLRDTLRTGMDASITGADAQAWREARRQYANLMVIRDAMNSGSINTTAGNLPPTALSSVLARGPQKNFAMGRGDLNDLARVGRAFVQDSVPDSGTAQRLMYQGLLTGAPAALLTGNTTTGMAAGIAGLAVPRAVQELYYSPAGRAYLTNQLADRVLPRVSPQALRAISATQARGLLD